MPKHLTGRIYFKRGERSEKKRKAAGRAAWTCKAWWAVVQDVITSTSMTKPLMLE